MKHCLSGLDVDLIMLGLVSKKKNFTLLREKLIENGKTQRKSLLMGPGQKNDKASDKFHLQESFLSRDVLCQEFQPRKILPINIF